MKCLVLPWAALLAVGCASAAGPTYEVVVETTVEADGTSRDCRIVSQDGGGEAVAQLALEACALFRFEPQVRDGAPIAGARVRAPIRIRPE
ncbi:MAG TPA: energy transducer TonB [Brevundimonas sp.]|jgi:TonB family protein|uniref:energy transducer TonB n=1 Tax=Brevundimonas sp. TaxID=1871086 RepID=UPI002E1513E2|nr:energy transducer TonB [Brevundimonas sp.]